MATQAHNVDSQANARVEGGWSVALPLFLTLLTIFLSPLLYDLSPRLGQLLGAG